MLEFTLSIVVILLCAYTIIEVGRYSMIRSMVSKAAEEGLNYAQKVGSLDLDIRFCADETCDDYVRYRAAREGVVRHAKRFLDTFLQPNTDVDSPNRMTSYRIVDSLDSFTATATPYEAELMVIRPGEMAYDVAAGSVVSHPTLCNPTDKNCPPGRLSISTDSSWTEVLKNNPYVVIVGAIYRPVVNFAPFNFPPVYVQSIAVGYREPRTNLRVPPDINFPIPPIIPPTPGPTAIPTPPCPGDFCGGSCIAPCIPPEVRDYSTCGCTSCTPPNTLCPGNQTCVPPCPGAKVLDQYSCLCRCTLSSCFPGQTRDPNTCECSGCNLPCGSGVPDSYCSKCDCSALPACPFPQTRDATCACVGSCPDGTSVCAGTCAPDPVTCEARDPATCKITPDCPSCGETDCSGSCRTASTLSSIAQRCVAAGPGFVLSADGCTCECNAVCGSCGHAVDMTPSGCICRPDSGLGCGTQGHLVCNADPGAAHCQCDPNGNCALGNEQGPPCGPLQCVCPGGFDCGKGTMTGGGDNPCTCSCDPSFSCGLGAMSNAGSGKCGCLCGPVNCHGGAQTGGGNSPCGCSCGGVTCPGGQTMNPADCSCS